MLNADDFQVLPRVPTIMAQLKLYAEKLHRNFKWDFLPQRYQAPYRVEDGTFPCVLNRFGSITIGFVIEGLTPSLGVGFLYDPSPSGVDLTTPDKGIDLVLSISADPRQNPDCHEIFKQLKAGRDRIVKEEKDRGQKIRTRIRLRDEPGNTNRWNLLIAQKCLADVVENCQTETEQLEAIYTYFQHLLNELFSDHELEIALKALRRTNERIRLSEGTTNINQSCAMWGPEAEKSSFRYPPVIAVH